MVGLHFQLCQGSWLSFKTLTAVAETPLSRQWRYMRHKERENEPPTPFADSPTALCSTVTDSADNLQRFLFFFFPSVYFFSAVT